MYYKQIYCPRAFGAGYSDLFKEVIYDAKPSSNFLTTRTTPPSDCSTHFGLDGTDVWIAWENDWSRCIIFNESVLKLETPELAKLFRFLKENMENEMSSCYSFEKWEYDILLKDDRAVTITFEPSSEKFYIKDESGNKINI